MDIECLIKREGNTHIVMGGYDYVFKLNDNGKKVCTILQEAHQKHFLTLKDFIEYRSPKIERIIPRADEVEIKNPAEIKPKKKSPKKRRK